MRDSRNIFDFIKPLFTSGKGITQGVKDTLAIIVDRYYAEVGGRAIPEHLAYILATAYHESYHATRNPEWRPVREGFASTDQGAINAVTKLFNQGKIKRNYALADPITKKSYYGRGFVQITHSYNYKKLGDHIGVPELYHNPDLALVPTIAASLLVKGMIAGLYTGKKLADYTSPNGGSFDAISARRIINGTDRAAHIASIYEKFLTAITSTSTYDPTKNNL